MIIIIIFSLHINGDDGETGLEVPNNQTGMGDPEEGLHINKDEDFKNKLKEYYMKSGGHSGRMRFGEEKKASQSFEKECNGHYDEFKTQLIIVFNSYYGMKNIQERQNKQEEKIREIKDLQQQCLDTLKNNLNILYGEVQKKLTNLKTSPSLFLKTNTEKIISIFEKIDEKGFDGAKELKNFFGEDLKNLKKCINTYFSVTEYGLSAKLPLEDILVDLHKGCSEARDKVKTFIKGSIFQQLVNLPSLCQSKGGCVANLRKSVGLDPQFVSLFQSCSEKREKTEVCCDSLENCEDPVAKQAVQSNKSSIQSLINSGDGNVCSSSNSGLKEIDKNLFDNTRDTCVQLTNICLNECDKKFKNFKSEFKNCFLVPGFKNTDFELHNNNACKRQIDDIKAEYEKNNAITTNNKVFNFLSNKDERITREIKNYCDVPLNEFNNKSIEMRDKARGIVEGWCSELLTEKNEKDGSENQTDNSFPTFNPRIPTIRSPSGGPSGGGPGGSYSPSSGFDIGGNSYEGGNYGGDTQDPNFGGKSETTASAGNYQRTPDESPTEEDENSDEDSFDGGSSANCVGICNVPEGKDEHSPTLQNYHQNMAEDSDLEELDDEVNEALRAEREARERGLSGSGDSAGGFAQGLQGRASNALGSFARAAKKPLKKAYEAAFGGPKSASPQLKDLLGIHGSNVDLMQRQRELRYMFCNTHSCGISKEEMEELKKEANK